MASSAQLPFPLALVRFLAWLLGVAGAGMLLCAAAWLTVYQFVILRFFLQTATPSEHSQLLFDVSVLVVSHGLVWHVFSRRIPGTPWPYRLLQGAMGLGHLGALLLWLFVQLMGWSGYIGWGSLWGA